MDAERVFLHDIATPLGTAMFVMDSVMDDLKSRSVPDVEAIEQLQQIHQSLEKLKSLLQARRQKLIAEQPK